MSEVDAADQSAAGLRTLLRGEGRTSLRCPSKELLPGIVEAELAGVLLRHDDFSLLDRVVDLVLEQ
jgi:hypothetical protein